MIICPGQEREQSVFKTQMQKILKKLHTEKRGSRGTDADSFPPK